MVIQIKLYNNLANSDVKYIVDVIHDVHLKSKQIVILKALYS